MSDLDNAINSINASAAKAENTATFLDDMSTFDDQSSVTNPNNGQTVASIPKQVKDRTDELFTAAESDINQAVSDAEQSATDAQDAADSIGRYQGLWPDTGGSALKGDTYQTQVSGTPTGQYFTALQDTTVDPVDDDVNWRAVVSFSSISGENLISNAFFEFAGSVTNPPDATSRGYNAGDELFHGVFAVAELTGVTYVNGSLNGTGQSYIDVYKSEKQKESTVNYVASTASSNGLPVESGASFVDNGDYWRVTFNMSDTFSVKFEQGVTATAHRAKSPFDIYGHPVMGIFNPMAFGAVPDESSTASKQKNKEVIEYLLDTYGALDLYNNFHSDPVSISDKDVNIRHFGGSVSFDHQGADSFTMTNCSGHIDGMAITDTKETEVGIYITFFMYQCQDLHVERLKVYGGKDLPVVMMDCDNCTISKSNGYGSDVNRPFAWEMIGCSNSEFLNSHLSKYSFGFLTIGAGYKSGEPRLTTSRDPLETLGMRTVFCSVTDHTGHAFDINGAVGAKILYSTAKDYTGTSGNTSFQVKQSTNIPEESARDTYANEVTGCTAENCVNGFGTQEGRGVRFKDNTVINAKRYPITLNDTPNTTIDGLTVYDWALDLTTWPLQNGDTRCAAVAIWNGSSNCEVGGLELNTSSDANHSSMSVITNRDSSTTLGKLSVDFASGLDLSAAIENDGNNLVILESFRCGVGYTDIVVDSTTTTTYPLTASIAIRPCDVDNYVMPDIMQRGFVPVETHLFYEGSSGGPTFSIGERSDLDKFLSTTTPVGNNVMHILKNTGEINLPQQPLYISITGASSANMSLQVSGLPYF